MKKNWMYGVAVTVFVCSAAQAFSASRFATKVFGLTRCAVVGMTALTSLEVYESSASIDLPPDDLRASEDKAYYELVPPTRHSYTGIWAELTGLRRVDPLLGVCIQTSGWLWVKESTPESLVELITTVDRCQVCLSALEKQIAVKYTPLSNRVKLLLRLLYEKFKDESVVCLRVKSLLNQDGMAVSPFE